MSQIFNHRATATSHFDLSLFYSLRWQPWQDSNLQTYDYESIFQPLCYCSLPFWSITFFFPQVTAVARFEPLKLWLLVKYSTTAVGQLALSIFSYFFFLQLKLWQDSNFTSNLWLWVKFSTIVLLHFTNLLSLFFLFFLPPMKAVARFEPSNLWPWVKFSTTVLMLLAILLSLSSYFFLPPMKAAARFEPSNLWPWVKFSTTVLMPLAILICHFFIPSSDSHGKIRTFKLMTMSQIFNHCATAVCHFDLSLFSSLKWQLWLDSNP